MLLQLKPRLKVLQYDQPFDRPKHVSRYLILLEKTRLFYEEGEFTSLTGTSFV